MLQIARFYDVKSSAWKSGDVKSLTNIMSAQMHSHDLVWQRRCHTAILPILWMWIDNELAAFLNTDRLLQTQREIGETSSQRSDSLPVGGSHCISQTITVIIEDHFMPIHLYLLYKKTDWKPAAILECRQINWPEKSAKNFSAATLQLLGSRQ